jgi:murein DD-endopeptidase MepM/ murein hydrolase activator NlpD
VRRTVASGVVLTALVAGLLFAGFPAAADVTVDEVEEARARLREINLELSDRVAEYEESVVREVELRDRLDGLLVDLAARERELTAARLAARERVAEIYMSAGSHEGASILAVGEFSQVPARRAYLDTVAQTDREVIVRLDAARSDYERQQGLLEEVLATQEALRSEMESLLEGIYAELESANADYQQIKTEWDRQEAERRYLEWLATSTTTTTTTLPPPTTQPPTTTTQAGPSTTEGDTTSTTAGTTTSTAATTTTTTLPPPPPQPGVMVCPVDGATTFRDSWLEPRPGGRQHHGVDMMAAEGTPLVAIEDGYIWYMAWHYAGGNGLYIQGDSGDRWYYAHMQGYAPGLTIGMPVSAGQLVGYVGDTGNATVPHLHLGWLIGGAYYENPYPVVAAIC